MTESRKNFRGPPRRRIEASGAFPGLGIHDRDDGRGGATIRPGSIGLATWGYGCAVRARLDEAGIPVVLTPYRAPNADAYAERFVRSIKEECLSRVIPLGERHFRRTIVESLPPGAESSGNCERADRRRVGDERHWRDSPACAALNYHERAA